MLELDAIELNPKYKNILKLDKKLTEARIPHELCRLLDGYMICYPSVEDREGDVITHYGSYGHEQDLLEAYEFPECEGDVIGNMTIEEAFKLFENAERRNNHAA